MQRHGGVTHAAALLVDNELWGFACPRTVDVEDVRRAAATILPYYAVPTRLVLIDTMPLTRFVVHLRVFVSMPKLTRMRPATERRTRLRSARSRWDSQRPPPPPPRPPSADGGCGCLITIASRLYSQIGFQHSLPRIDSEPCQGRNTRLVVPT
jgi:hypothetical protein